MFARAISFSVLALPLLATAIALPGGSPSSPSCAANSGALTCCNSVQSPTSSGAALLLGLLGIVVSTVEGLVGLTCSPILGSGGCNEQTVCCTNNSFNGLVAIGCSPINVNL